MLNLDPLEFQLTQRQSKLLSGRHTDRVKAIKRQLVQGASFDAAWKETENCYDTLGAYKIGSRVARGAGSVSRATANLCSNGEHIAPESIREILNLCREIALLCVEHMEVMASYPHIAKHQVTLSPESTSNDAKTTKATLNQAIGCLKVMKRFLAKNVQDIPMMPMKATESRYTMRSEDCVKIAVNLGRTVLKVALIEKHFGDITETVSHAVDYFKTRDLLPAKNHQR